MKALRSRMLAVGVSLLFFASVASSKLSVSKLLISGGRLSQPVEVTDAPVLRASNPWFGTFIPQWNQAPRQRIAGPPKTATRYELSFYAAAASTQPPHIIYVAYYAFDSEAHRGFVYLPGSNEQWYYTNVRNIVRPNQDGRWNLADPAWCDQINSVISQSQGH